METFIILLVLGIAAMAFTEGKYQAARADNLQLQEALSRLRLENERLKGKLDELGVDAMFPTQEQVTNAARHAQFVAADRVYAAAQVQGAVNS